MKNVEAVVSVFWLSLLTVSCAPSQQATEQAEEVTLRIGVGDASSASAQAGLRQLTRIFSIEGLARIAEDGRPEPRLAETWSLSSSGLSMKIRLRPNAKFHDGSSVTGAAVANTLNKMLPQFMGPVFEDVQDIAATSDYEVEIVFRKASPFLVEALELPIEHPDNAGVGTGPFRTLDNGSSYTLMANDQYYLGRPEIDRITVTNYSSVRAAWADLLRDQVDMLYEVSSDALDSLSGAKALSVFTFTRPYQYVIAFNPDSPKLQRASVRRALNAAVDREALVRDALNGHGSVSKGPIWPRHWAVTGELPGFQYSPGQAATELGSLRFKCLVPTGYERLALLLKRQLEMVGVEMEMEEVSPDGVYQALASSSFEAVLLDLVSGPSLFRTYQWWRSGGSLNQGAFGSTAIDAALDKIRHATSDDDYRSAVAEFQRTIIDDPPAIFLAWSERARAVSRRFNVEAEPGQDILTTLRLWRPTTDPQFVGRN